MRLAGKHALVTGGASGIGKACCVALAREGAHVLVTDRNGDGAAIVAQAIGGKARSLDVTDEAAWTDLPAALDILVCSAGIGVMGDIEHAQLADLRLMMAVNVEGVFLGARAAVPLMRARGGGSIIAISSVAGLIADPNLAGYCASKGAVRLLSKSIALHGARDNIRCNSVHPSFIDTPMVADMVRVMDDERARERLTKAAPLGRLGQADEVAAMIVYLASDESKFVTGAEFVIDGGLTAR